MPEVTKEVRSCNQVRVVADERASLAAREVLRLLKTEATDRPQSPELLASPLRFVCLAGVFDDGQIVLAGNRKNLVHVGRPAQNVHGKNRAGVLSDAMLDIIRVELERPH